MKKERKGKEKWMVSENTIDIYFLRFLRFYAKMFVNKRMEKKPKIVKKKFLYRGG